MFRCVFFDEVKCSHKLNDTKNECVPIHLFCGNTICRTTNQCILEIVV